MSIKVIKGGMQTTIQDFGRSNLMHLGICQGGVMDSLSASLANRLVGNPVSHPVLEICMLGPRLEFTQAMSIAVSGAEFVLRLHRGEHSQTLNNNQMIHIQAGDTLVFGRRIQGARAYLAFAAELALPKVLDSYSTHLLANFGGYQGRALTAGDTIPLSNYKVSEKAAEHQEPIIQSYLGKYMLRCTDSVETDLFSDVQKDEFYEQSYQVTQASNRMGLRIESLGIKRLGLEGQYLADLGIEDITSSGLLPGSIQIPPNGQPIISSVDGQTIGGYPRIANVISADLFALGQLVPRDIVQFIRLSQEQAQSLNLGF